MDKEEIKIEAYDGEDAYYEGTESDYEDFLKDVEENINQQETEVHKVAEEDSDKTGFGETINIKGVLDMFRKKAGEIGNAAKKMGNDVKEQINDFKNAAAEKENLENTRVITLDSADVVDTKDEQEEAKPAIKLPKSKKEEMASRVDEISVNINELVNKIDAVSSKINDMDAKQTENKNSYDRNENEKRVTLTELSNDLSEIKLSINNVAKLSDGFFDLKNTQQNTKKSLVELEMHLISLKKKCILGITVISILSAMVILLQLVNLLS